MTFEKASGYAFSKAGQGFFVLGDSFLDAV